MIEAILETQHNPVTPIHSQLEQANDAAMAPDRQTLLGTANAFARSYDEWTVESALRIRTSDCTHQVHPASLQRPCMTNDGLAASFESIKKLYQGYKITVREDETLVDVENRSVVLHADGTADTILGPFRNEYIFILKMDESGSKVRRVEEFVDSAAVVDLVPRIKAEWAKQSN
ncbi:hypothetical protein F5B17DRAFT_399699 [Nemania serpens]|nr:hypothetical protein F5B17DRAFT_399699 [Nemania serpens]